MGTKMSNPDRKLLREAVAERIKEVKFNPERRIHLPKEKIDELLFDYKDGYKCLVCTIEGLCKIDLSEADFTNAILQPTKTVDLSNTNVNIVFTELFYRGNVLGQTYTIQNVDFSGVDLSNSFGICNDQWELTFNFENCDLSNTGLKTKTHSFLFKGCNLEGLNFNEVKFECKSLRSDRHILMTNGDERSYNVGVQDCNLSNTGAIINVTDKTLKKDIQKGKFGHLHETISVQVEEYIAKQYRRGKLAGCTIKGMNLKSALEKISEKKVKPREKKDTGIESIIEETISMIDSQIPSLEMEHRESENRFILPSKEPKKYKLTPEQEREVQKNVNNICAHFGDIDD